MLRKIHKEVLPPLTRIITGVKTILKRKVYIVTSIKFSLLSIYLTKGSELHAQHPT